MARKQRSTFLDGYKANFDTLQRAMQRGRVCIMECLDTRTNEKVAVLAAVSGAPGGEVDMVPLGLMLAGNPYDYLAPPTANGGFEIAAVEGGTVEAVPK